MKNILFLCLALSGFAFGDKKPDDIQKAIGETEPAIAADKKVMEASGGSQERSEKIYQISSEIFSALAKKHEGDPDKMQKEMEAAMKNPAAFAETLPAEQKEKIRRLAAEIEKEKAMP